MACKLQENTPSFNFNDEEAFLSFCQLIPHAVFIAVNSTVISCNESGAKLMGFTDPGQIKGRSVKEFIHPDFTKDFKKSKSSFNKNEKKCFIIETKLISNDKNIIDVQISISRFRKKGNLVTYLIVKDITEENKMKRELKMTEENYKTLMEMLPDAVCLRNSERMLYANSAAVQVLGCKSPDDIEGRDIKDFISSYPPGKVCMTEFENELLINGCIPFREITYMRKSDEKIFTAETGIKLIKNGDEPLFLVIARDISDKKRKHELEMEMLEKTRQLNETVEYDKLRTEFFANISHEFRTPLNVILSALQLSKVVIKESPACDHREKMIKYNNLMQQNCYRLIKLINNFIDITKIDTGYFNIMPEECNIVSIVEDITLSVKSYIENKGISLTFDTDEEEINLVCDPDKIERIMLNLLSNAIKFTNAPGSITVKVSHKNDKVFISVKDTGIGISEDKVSFIFDRFRQVDKSLSRNREGSGIGLSLVKSLVEMHGGNISLRSVFREGSEFIVELPIKSSLDKKLPVKKGFFQQSNLERISIEFSDIYF